MKMRFYKFFSVSACAFFLFAAASVSGCKSNEDAWDKYEQDAAYAKDHPGTNTFDSLEAKINEDNAKMKTAAFSEHSSLKKGAGDNDPYSAGYAIGYDDGVLDGKEKSRGVNLNVNPDGMGYSGDDAEQYTSGYNLGYEEGYARGAVASSAYFDQEVVSRIKARKANETYLKNEAVKTGAEQSKATRQAESDIKQKEADRAARRDEIKKEEEKKVREKYGPSNK